jgi:hypothetical protein
MNLKDIQLERNIGPWLRLFHPRKPLVSKFVEIPIRLPTWQNRHQPRYINSDLRGGCHVGDIPSDSLSQIAEKLGEIPIVKHNSSWDCQI